MKKLFYVVLIVLVTVMFVACKKKNNEEVSEEFKPSLDTSTKCSITIVGSYDNFEALEAEFDRFNEYYPDVELNYVKLDDYNNTLATALTGNDKPNIFFSYTWMMGNEKYNSVIDKMEDLSNPNLKFNLNCIRPGLINKDSKGSVLMVPVFSRTYGMLVNNDLFKKEGLSVPETWQDLLNVCKAFKDKGYASPLMGYSEKSSSCLMNTVAYPICVAELAKDQNALAQANDLNPKAGQFMRFALERVKELKDAGCFDLSECDQIKDNYGKVILRFFEGDVPMMACAGDTVSGTKKRESQSEAFTNNPFAYSFLPIPTGDKGGYFIDSPSIEFSVNKDCDNLDMTNEFMRFLISNKELNEMASIKRLVTPTKDLSFDAVYAPFGKISQSNTFSPELLGIKDALTVQIRVASYKVGRGELTIDEAIELYGTYE